MSDKVNKKCNSLVQYLQYMLMSDSQELGVRWLQYSIPLSVHPARIQQRQFIKLTKCIVPQIHQTRFPVTSLLTRISEDLM